MMTRGQGAIRPGPLGPMRQAVWRALGAIETGTVVISDSLGARTFGRGAPLVRVHVHAAAFYRRVVFGGATGAGESYLDGEWDCDDLVALVRIMARNRQALAGVEGPAAAPLGLARRGHAPVAAQQRPGQPAQRARALRSRGTRCSASSSTSG